MSKYSLDQFNYSLKTNSWDRVPRDPVTVGSLIFGGGGFTVLTASQMLISQIIFYAGATLVAGYLLRALTPKIERGSELLANIKDPAAPREIVYGEVRKGGTVTHLESTDDNQYLHMFIALAGHEIESVEKIYINDEDHTSNWTRSTGIITGTTDTEKDWSGKVRVFSHLGAQTSATDTFEDSTETLSSTYHTETELATVNSNFVGKGVAYLYVRLDYDADVFEDGIPTVTAVVRGKKVQNENGVVQTYPASANAAYVIRDYLINEYGVDDDSANIDTSAFSTAATVCNTSSGSGASNKFLVNGVLSTGNSRIENLEQLTATCGGALFWSAGQWVLKAAAFTSSVKTLDLTDLRSKVQINTKHSGRDNFNTVRGTFNDQDQDWIEVDYPQVTSSTYLTEDNDQRSVLDLSFPLVTVSAQAQRLAKLTLNRHREQLTMTANFGLNAFNLEVGDVINFNDYNSETDTYRYGFHSPVEKTWEVIGWRFAPVENNDLQVQLTLRETSPTAFNWDADEETIVSNNTNLPNMYAGLTVSNISVTDKGNIQEDGTFVGQAEVSWTQAVNKFINHYEIQYKDVNESSYITTTVPSSESSVIITSLEVGTQYNIRVRAVTEKDQKSSWVSSTPYTHGGDTIAPAAVGTVTPTAMIQAVSLDWAGVTTDENGNTLYDLKGYNIYRAVTNSQPSSPIAFVAADKYVDGGLTDSTEYYYWVAAVDHTGNEGTASASGAVTTLVGASGEDGQSVALLQVFRRSSSSLSAPTGGSFNFSTTTLTAPTDWSVEVPSGTDPIYVSQAIASIEGATGTDTELTWSTPVLFVQNGADGADGAEGPQGPQGLQGIAGDAGEDGKSVYTAIVFNRYSSAPSAPSGGSFNFGTNTLTAPSGWFLDIPSGSNPIYGTRATFSISGDTGTDSNPTWSTPFKIAEDGADGLDGSVGADGLSTFLASVFKRSSSAPATPSGGSYNFSTNTLTAPSGWSNTIPSGTNPVYVSTALASVQGVTGTDSSLGWVSPIKLAENGADGAQGPQGPTGSTGPQGPQGVQGVDGPAGPTGATGPQGPAGSNGTNGTNGARYATVRYYQLATSAPSTSGLASSVSYTWSSGSATSSYGSWTTATPTVSATSSSKLWYVDVVFVDTTGTASSSSGTVSGSVTQLFNFNGLVTFTNTSGSTSLNDALANSSTIIDGGRITTGTIDADAISASTITADFFIGAGITRLATATTNNNQTTSGVGNFQGWYSGLQANISTNNVLSCSLSNVRSGSVIYAIFNGEAMKNGSQVVSTIVRLNLTGATSLESFGRNTESSKNSNALMKHSIIRVDTSASAGTVTASIDLRASGSGGSHGIRGTLMLFEGLT